MYLLKWLLLMLTLQIDSFYIMLPPKDFLNSKKNKHMPSLIGMQVVGTDSISIPHEEGGIQLTFSFLNISNIHRGR